MQNKKICEMLNAPDPLCEENYQFLLNYKEEDSLIDFKEDFRDEDESWLKLTKDIVSFANTDGGYILFGIRDGSFEQIGLSSSAITALGDADKILQKVNRSIDPRMTRLRCKGFSCNGKKFILLCIPSFAQETYIFSEDGKFRYPSGSEKFVFHKGTIWVRKSGGNQIADARDLDYIFGKRLNHFRDSLLQKIARVVEAPPQTEIFVIDPGKGDAPHKTFTITDAPDAIPVKGLSFIIPPRTPEEEIAAWIAMATSNPEEIPSKFMLWRWYAIREKLSIRENIRLWLAKFSIVQDIPFFYWMQGCTAENLKAMISEVTTMKMETYSGLTLAAAFLGKGFYNEIIRRMGKRSERLPMRLREYPEAGPWCLISGIEMTRMKRGKVSEREHREEIRTRLNEIVAQACDNKGTAGAYENHMAQQYDCFLYAQDDKYVQKEVGGKNTK